MLVVGGGAEQRCRLRALLEQKSAPACPTFVLFPHAPRARIQFSARDGAASVPSPIAAFACKIIVPDGSWECCRAMVNALHARQIQNSTNQLRYVHLDKDRVAAYHSPLIESLKAGQGLGRISTLEAIALLLDEASGAAEAAVGAVAVRPVSSPLASVLIHRGLTPLVSYIKRKKTALSALRPRAPAASARL